MNKVSYRLWGNVQNQEVYLFKIENASGAYVELTNYGAAIVSINVPDCNNELGNVILGYPALAGYLADTCYIGATIGRFANRIANAEFSLDNVKYQLEANDGVNSNHGASAGFNSKVFSFKVDGDMLSFSLFSKDGEGGYPGNLDFQVIYQWTDDDELIITYTAVTDKKTIANFTNHAYFNLNCGTSNILDHELTIYSDLIVEADKNHIPSGFIVPAGNLSFKQNKIKEKVVINNGQVFGLNICYFLDDKKELLQACLLSDQVSGRKMEVFTTYPGLLLYTGDYLTSKHSCHHSKVYHPYDGLCLECQYFPDSPNHSHFPSVTLNPAEVYNDRIIFKFSTEP